MRLEGIWFRYGRRDRWALRAVSATVEPGTATIVLGRNGAGKSTLLQIAAGTLRPNRGGVRDRPSVVGWVPERFAADQPHTVQNYLWAIGEIRGLRGPVATRAVDYWIERLGLGPYRRAKLPALSKGTAQKVGLAQAVLRAPGLLVLDEPWEGLDAATRDLVPQLVGEVLAGGGAVLVSDHRGETARLPGAARWTVTEGVIECAGGELPAGRPAATAAPAGWPQAPALLAGRPEASAVPAGWPEVAAVPAGQPQVPAVPAGRREVAAVPAGWPEATGTAAAGAPEIGVPGDGDAAEPSGAFCVIEVAAPAGDAEHTVARLREQGHQVLRVRRGRQAVRPAGAVRAGPAPGGSGAVVDGSGEATA